MPVKYNASKWTERLAICSLFLFSMGLIQLTAWKESHIFWRNIGGYPLWLRDCLKTFYYPYLLVLIIAASMLTRNAITRLFRKLEYGRIWLLLVAAWVIIIGCMAMMMTNNMLNLIQGQSLHHH